MILVGIVNGKDRTHDLSPAATGATAKQFPTADGASQFVDFFLQDVLPAVRTKYRTVPATFLAGHSFGGLVALHSASTRRDSGVRIVRLDAAGALGGASHRTGCGSAA